MKPGVLLIVAGVITASCAHGKGQSWSAPMSEAEGKLLAGEVVAIVKEDLPPGTTTLWVLGGTGKDALKGALEAAFGQAGYAVKSEKAADAKSLMVRYVFAPLADGFTLRVQVGRDLELGRWYYRRDGTLVSYAPVSVGRSRR